MNNTIDPVDPEGGNTISPSVPVKRQVAPALNWFFTWNNYEIQEVELAYLQLMTICTKIEMQEEKGENGTPHIQGCIELIKKARPLTFGLDKKIHWEKTKSKKAASEYCLKEESRTGKQWIYPHRATLKLITEAMFRECQKEIFMIKDNEPNDRTIHWFIDKKGGCGKSALARLMKAKYGAHYIKGGKGESILFQLGTKLGAKGYQMKEWETIIIDYPRTLEGMVSYTALETIKDGMICSTKYEGVDVMINSPHLIVFANWGPRIEAMSLDRWDIRELVENKWVGVNRDNVR